MAENPTTENPTTDTPIQPEPKKRKTRDLVVRIAVWGTLAVAAVLVLIEYQQKNAAEATVTALRDATTVSDNDTVDRELRLSQVGKLIRGNPKKVSQERPRGMQGPPLVDTYTWTGLFRTYQVEITYGLPKDDPSVLNVLGPAEMAAAGE